MEKPPVDRAIDRTESSALFIQLGRPGGEPLLSGSGHSRLSGRPLGSTVKFLTVGWSTGRSIGRAFWPFSAANGQIFKGAINTPFEVDFHQEFKEPKFLYSLVFLYKFQKSFGL